MRKNVHGKKYIYCDYVGCTEMHQVDAWDDELIGWGKRYDDKHYCNSHLMELYEAGELNEKKFWTPDWERVENIVVTLYHEDKSLTLVRPASAYHARKIIVIYQDAYGEVNQELLTISEMAEKYTIPIKVLRQFDMDVDHIPSVEEYERFVKERELHEKIHGKSAQNK